MWTNIRPLVLPVGLIVLALTVFNLRISREMVDFEVYRTAGKRVVAAATLYQSTDGHYTFKYLPAFAVAMVPIAALGHDAARIVWFALSCACLVIFLRWSVIALPARRWSVRTLILFGVVLLGKFYAHELTLGQSNLLLAVVLMAGFGALQLEAPRLAAVLFGLAVFVKPYALILLPWLAVSYGLGPAIVSVVTIGAGLVLPAAVYGWTGNLGQLAGWWHIVSSSTAPNLVSTDNVSMAGMWAKWIGTGSLAAVLAALTTIVLLAVAAAVWMQRRRVETPEYLEFALLLILIPLVSPQGWSYMLLLGTPAVILIVDRWRELPAPWRWSSGVALIVMGLSLFDLMGRGAYTQFMAWSSISVCALVVVATLAQIRLRGLA